MEQFNNDKGSKLQMEKLIFPENKDSLHQIIPGSTNLEWKSPIKGNDGVYHEIQLNNDKLLKQIFPNSFQEVKDKLLDFWPSREPQWDGLALGDDNVIYLFEGKSHLSEVSPAKRFDISIASEDARNNYEKKSTHIKETSLGIYHLTEEDWELVSDAWIRKYYQVANRLAFTAELNSLLEKYSYETQYKKAVMNFIHFLEDDSNDKVKPVRVNDNKWEKKYEKIFREMKLGNSYNEGISKLNKQNVFLRYVDVRLFKQ